MSTDLDLITIYFVTTARQHLAAIETTLVTISGDIAPLNCHPVLGTTDLHFLSLCRVEGHLAGIRSERLAAVAGPEAAVAIQGYQASFRRLRDVYGAVCGPERHHAARDALHWALRTIASDALGHLTVYTARTAALEAPPFEEYQHASARHLRSLRRRIAPPALSPVPKVRIPLDRETVARRARAALGCGFGGLGGVYLTMRMPPNKHTGMIALLHLSEIVEHVGAQAAKLAGRCPNEYTVFADHAQGIADDLNALFHRFEEATIQREIAPEAVAGLAENILPSIHRCGDAIRAIDGLTGEPQNQQAGT